MSARSLPSVVEIIARYAAGYFPLYDMEDQFYWERLPIRAILPVDGQAAERAAKLGRRARGKFQIRYTTAVDRVIAILQDEKIRSRTWVRREVVAIYRALHTGGLLQTVEAFDVATGELAGALLGLVLPGTFVAETMISLKPDASKVCLCQLMADALAAGHRMIDVQTPHDLDELAELGVVKNKEGTAHPCVRLGERVLPQSHFMRMLAIGVRETFPGTMLDWIKVAGTLAAAGRDTKAAGGLVGAIDPLQLRAAWPMLKNCYPRELAAVVGA